MPVLRKRETLVQNITYMAIMAAINVVFVLITYFVPVLVFLLVFFLPLTSTIVTLYCRKRYYIIYAVVTVGLCMLVTMFDVSDTLFYVLPSVIAGFLFGVFILAKVPSIWIILVTGLIELGVQYAMIPVIQAWYGVNIIDTFASAFGVADFIYLDYITPCFLFFLAITQSVLSYFVIKGQLPKFNYHVTLGGRLTYLPYIVLVGLIGLSLLFSYTYQPMAYLSLMISLVLGIYLIVYACYTGGMKMWISMPIMFFIGVIMFAALYGSTEKPMQFMGMMYIVILTSLTSLVNDVITTLKTRHQKQIEINPPIEEKAETIDN